MVRKFGPKCHVALKIDLDKAYDCLEWSFIQESLEFFQIPPTLTKLIVNMFSSTRFHIMWNGAPLSAIVLSRGCVKGILYLFICLSCVWNAYPFFWKKQFETTLSILSRSMVKLKFRIYSLRMISFSSLRQRLQIAIILKTLYTNSVSVQAKSLVHKNHVSGFHKIHPGKLKILLLVFLMFLLQLKSEPTQELLFFLPTKRLQPINTQSIKFRRRSRVAS